MEVLNEGRHWQSGADERMALYKRAAVLSDPAGQCNLAISYLKGQGVDRNLSKAARWYLKAAEGGYDRAM
ncbi:hypothetical protein QQ045_013316 [Rhodiola kirilowii]